MKLRVLCICQKF